MATRMYASTHVTQFMGDHTVIAPPVGLRGKAVVRINPSDRTDQDRLERAERALVNLSRYFAGWMEDELVKLANAYARYLRACEDNYADAHWKLRRTAYNLRGNAEQFGYPVAARVAEKLCTMLGNNRDRRVPAVVMDQYIDAIRSILRFGPGQDPTAIEIADALQELIQKPQFHLI